MRKRTRGVHKANQTFDVTMKNVLAVAMVQALQKLLHVAFHLLPRKMLAIGHLQTGEIMIHVLKDHIDSNPIPFIFGA